MKTSIEKHPLVTIVMTTYNAEKHIDESLKSALAQDIIDIEIVCVDGHSTDNTVNIIHEYEKKDARIRLIYQDRAGIGAAKNCGIENAKGEYITFLDADDFYVDKTALRKMYHVCKKEHVSVCGAFRSTLFMDGYIEKEPLHRNDCNDKVGYVRLRYIDRPYDYHFHSYLYERGMIQNSNARFAEVKAYDDTHFFIRAMLLAKEFCVVPVELYRYRCGPAYDWDMEKANDAILSLIDQLRISKKNNLAILHWLTTQRINYEYGNIFEKNVLNGDMELLDSLIVANKEVDSDMIAVVENNPPEDWYLEPMMHRRVSDMPLRSADTCYSPRFVLEPLWKIMHPEQRPVPQNDGLAQQEENIIVIHKSFLLRKIHGGIRCLKENGIGYTVRLFMKKVKSHIERY